MQTLLFDKAICKGLRVSISKTGNLWFSKLCEIEMLRDATHIAITYDKDNDVMGFYPFRPPKPWWCQPDEAPLWSVEDNGVMASVPWVKNLAADRGLYGQYLPTYNAETNTIKINLRERVKKYGK